VQKQFRNYVKRRRRSDGDIMALMEQQERLLAGIEATRLARKLTIERFAQAAGLTERGYRKALSGLVVVRASTIAKLRNAQRKAAAGALS